MSKLPYDVIFGLRALKSEIEALVSGLRELESEVETLVSGLRARGSALRDAISSGVEVGAGLTELDTRRIELACPPVDVARLAFVRYPARSPPGTENATDAGTDPVPIFGQIVPRRTRRPDAKRDLSGCSGAA